MEEPNILTIASIHATVLGIIVAALLIVVSLLGDKKLSLLQDVIQTHRTVDALFPSDWRIPMFLFSNKDDPNLNAENRDVRHHLISSVIEASMGFCSTPICPRDKFGKTIVLGLASLETHYPLLSSNRDLSGGKIELDPEFYKKWLEDIRETLSSLRELENYHEETLQMVRAYQDSQRGLNKEAVEMQEEYNKGLKKDTL
jgi:hypothetical protein